ncbi:MAG: hypothetical protein M1825_005089 [Sarcosagium campestre]|nr:MAG: hypothetical protein M1825_005089 [Sarcosagium campestre]
MSLLEHQEFSLYHLRTSHLSTIKDGVGERLISVDPAVFNTPGLRSAGWYPQPADIRRTYSPPIPTAIASEYFQVPPRSAGLQTPSGFLDDDDEGGMVRGNGSGETVGPGLNAKRRRRREQIEDDDSSDLSDESDDDGEGSQRAAQQIKFAKMPVRTRSGSSPIRKSSARDGPSLLVTSPSRRSGESRLRRGSLGAVEAVKQRARRDTTTSSDLSSENEMDPLFFKRQQVPAATTAAKAGRRFVEQMAAVKRQDTKESTDLEDEDEDEDDDGLGDDSDGTTLSSEFARTADSASLLNGDSNPLTSSPLSQVADSATPMESSPRKSKAAPSVLQALPPPRPISTVLPVSALSLAINAKKSKAANPLERFATLSGKGDPNPLNLKIYAPFSSKPTEPYEVPIQRFVREDGKGERKVAVVDAIGLSLWRYSEEKLAPAVASDKMNVNHWTLRMVEDEEVDFDFPALERTKPLNDFTSNNNRAARSRSSSKAYDEFALVEASEQQYIDNDRLTPNPVAESAIQETSEDVTPMASPAPTHSAVPSAAAFRRNPVLGPSFNPSFNPRPFATPATAGAHSPADAPATPASHATPRTGPSKLIKIHLTSPEGYPQFVALHVTTDTYLAEILDTVCKRRNLDKAHHVLKVSNTNVVAPLDRTIESLGDRSEIDLVRRRFGGLGADGSSNTLTGSPGSTPPNAPLMQLLNDGSSSTTTNTTATTNTSNTTISSTSSSGAARAGRAGRRAAAAAAGATTTTMMMSSSQQQMLHPLAQKQDLLLLPAGLSGNYKRYSVWRKQPMSFMPTHERTLALDGEYVHIMPGETGKSTLFDSSAKTTTVHVGAIVGCKSARKHPSNFSFVVYRSPESKRYDFEAQSPAEAAEIVAEIKKRVEPFQSDL